jgi:hypothetical protein
VAAAAVLGPVALDLLHGVHGEATRPLEPELVAGALEQPQERVTVPGGPVAEVRALAQRPRLPGQLAAGAQQPLVLVVCGR